jgi:hypothetical protein
MRSLLNNLTLLQDNNIVCFDDCREPMSDSYCRSALRYLVQSFLDDLLAPDIDSACCFVEDKDFWSFYNTSCNCDSLTLATAELDACITDKSSIALRIVRRLSKLYISDLLLEVWL